MRYSSAFRPGRSFVVQSRTIRALRSVPRRAQGLRVVTTQNPDHSGPAKVAEVSFATPESQSGPYVTARLGRPIIRPMTRTVAALVVLLVPAGVSAGKPQADAPQDVAPQAVAPTPTPRAPKPAPRSKPAAKAMQKKLKPGAPDIPIPPAVLTGVGDLNLRHQLQAERAPEADDRHRRRPGVRRRRQPDRRRDGRRRARTRVEPTGSRRTWRRPPPQSSLAWASSISTSSRPR